MLRILLSLCLAFSLAVLAPLGTLCAQNAPPVGQPPDKDDDAAPWRGPWESPAKEETPKKELPKPIGNARPSLDDPDAIVWDGVDWAVLISVGAVAWVGGYIGTVALYQNQTNVCADGPKGMACFEDNPISSAFLGAGLGGPMASALAVYAVGRLMGHEGTFKGALLGSLVGSLMFLAGFGGGLIATDQERVFVGSVVGLIAAPLMVTGGYYLSQDKAVRIGETRALLERAEDGAWSATVPTVTVSPEAQGGTRLYVPLLQGSF